MSQEDSLIFSYDEKIENDSIKEPFLYMNNNCLISPIYENNDLIMPFDLRDMNLYEPANIIIDEIENIKKEKIDFDEKESKEIKISNYDNDKNYDNSIICFHDLNYPKLEIQSTDNCSKVLSLANKELIIKQNNINIKNDNLFKTVLHHKRGRKKNLENNKINEKIHYSNDFDNIQRKIQVHFINFLIKLANDALITVFGKKTEYQFKDILYKFKKIINHEYVENLKKKTYGDILQMKISTKNKKFEENRNKEIFIKVVEESVELKKLFEKNYLYMFQKYYYNIKNINDKNVIDFEGFKIALSPQTKTYINLLKKNNENKDKFISTTQDIYFSKINFIDKKFVVYSHSP